MMENLNWSIINTALLLGAIGYLYRQARIVDQVRQVLLGMEGQGGIITEVKLLRDQSQNLTNQMATLSEIVAALTRTMQEQFGRRASDRP